MSLSRRDEQTLALAGLVQACYLVSGIARTGLVGQDSLAGCLEGIFVTEPETALDVYPSGNGVRTGLRLITELLSRYQVSDHGDTVRYAWAVLQLEKRLRADPERWSAIGAGIEHLQSFRALQSLGVDDEEVVERLSRLYEETAGGIEPRIRVLGQQKHLQNPANTQRIRALLLAGLRSAVLWRQLDGRLTQLVLGRNSLRRSADMASEMINSDEYI